MECLKDIWESYKGFIPLIILLFAIYTFFDNKRRIHNDRKNKNIRIKILPKFEFQNKKKQEGFWIKFINSSGREIGVEDLKINFIRERKRYWFNIPFTGFTEQWKLHAQINEFTDNSKNRFYLNSPTDKHIPISGGRLNNILNAYNPNKLYVSCQTYNGNQIRSKEYKLKRLRRELKKEK